LSLRATRDRSDLSNFYKKNKVDYRIYHPKHKLLEMSMHKQKRNDDAYFRIV